MRFDIDLEYEVSKQQIKQLLTIASSAPSAWNLQHWNFLAITEQEAKQKLAPIAYGQRQIIEASAVIAVLGDLEADRNAEEVYTTAVQAGLMSEQVRLYMMEQVTSAYADRDRVYCRDEAIRSASLAAMQLMLATKAAGLDSCPMVGYDPVRLADVFHIPPRYVSVMLIAIGKAKSEAYPSARFPIERKVYWNEFLQK